MKKLITLTTSLAFSLLSMATVQTVTNTNDTGAGSLRDQIANAADGDTVRLASSLIATGSATITLQSEIAFSKSLTIIGAYNATDTVFISGGNTNRIFNITATTNIYLDSVILIDGFTTTNGGAIIMETSDSLFVVNSIIANNAAANGGGIYISSSSSVDPSTTAYLHIDNSTITNNTAVSDGGGLNCFSLAFSATSAATSASIINVTNSTISNNSANNGGGIYNYSFALSSTVTSSTAPNSTVILTNSTVSNNVAANEGGAIYGNSFSSVTTTNTSANINNSTLYNNQASADGNSIFLGMDISSLTIKGSIIHAPNNAVSNVLYAANNNTFTTQGYNIFSDSLNETFASTDFVSVNAADLNLDILANNGGTTLTHLPLAGSVALENGDPTDLSDAQNKQIIGVREIGSTSFCSTTGTDTVEACVTYTWIDGNTYTANTDSATFTIVTADGCDSVVTLVLTINSPNTGVDTQVACDSYTWIDGNTYTASNNTATDTLTNVFGCDSVVTLNLTITNSTTGVDTQVSCDTYSWIDGNTYTSSNNTATFTLTNAVGCDSIVTLNLTINNSTTGTDTQTACDSYTWIDGNTYTTSNNTATFTLLNAVGCDSVVTLDLTLNNSTTGTDTQVACISYTWIDGNTYTTDNNTATFMTTTSAGCDSLVTLNLTINSTVSGTDTQIACETYTWIDGNTYTANNNSATFTLTSATGCDSIVTLDLTVNTPTTGTDTQVACETFTWIDGTTYTSSNNTATATLTNAVGCDSIVTLDLTINNTTTGTDTQVACETFTWIDGNTYTNNNNTANFVLTNANGCDSIVTLDLTINTVDIGVSVSGVTITANQTGATYQWVDCDDNNAVIPGETNSSFTAISNGNYACIITINGCQSTTNCEQISSVGITEASNKPMFKVYPNPTTGVFFLEMQTTAVQAVNIYSINGQLIFNQTTGLETVNQLNINAAPGIYFVEVVTNESKKVLKLTKE